MSDSTERDDDAPEAPPPKEGPSADAPRPSFRDALRGLRRAASDVAEAGAEEARKLAEAARPEVERRAKQAKAAAEAARPHVEQKAREATEYVREHQDDILRASKRGAGVAASGAARAATPGPLRPAVDAMQRELRTPSEEDAVSSEVEDAADTASPEAEGADTAGGDEEQASNNPS